MDSGYLDLTTEEADRASRLHEESIIIDGLIPRLSYLSAPEYRDRLNEANVTAANFTVAHWPHDYASASELIAKVHEWVEENPERFKLVSSTEDIREAHREDRTGVILGFQDAKPIEKQITNVRSFGLMDVRIVQLTYNMQNYLGAGCCERGDGGLTVFGEEVIDELQKQNILIDLSHCADRTTMDAIEYATDPVAFTHVGVRELCNAYGRCKTDEQIKAVAETGGVVGVIGMFAPIIKRDPDTHEVLQAELDDVLDQIDYVVDLVGIDHVGIGTDMHDKGYDEGPDSESSMGMRKDHPEVFGRGPTDQYDPPPTGLERHRKLENLTGGLVKRGYSDTEIRKILGENFLRVFEEVWE